MAVKLTKEVPVRLDPELRMLFLRKIRYVPTYTNPPIASDGIGGFWLRLSDHSHSHSW